MTKYYKINLRVRYAFINLNLLWYYSENKKIGLLLFKYVIILF